jgi:hypothetical protein
MGLLPQRTGVLPRCPAPPARGLSHAATVRFVSGDEKQYPYIELGGVRFNRSKGLKLYFDAATVTIQGVALDKMTGILQEQRVKYVHEKHDTGASFKADKKEGYIETIEIGKPDLEAMQRKP